jgi:hypothetical protein
MPPGKKFSAGTVQYSRFLSQVKVVVTVVVVTVVTVVVVVVVVTVVVSLSLFISHVAF